MKASVVFMFLASLVLLTVANPLRALQQRDGIYDVGAPLGVMTYNNIIDGAPVTVTGSVEDIIASLHISHPVYAAKIEAQVAATVAVTKRSTSTDSVTPNPAYDLEGLSKRYNFGATFCCPVPGQDWSNVRANFIISSGIPYLRNLGGTCTLKSNHCTRVSCSNSAAILGCSDNGNDIAPNCADLGDEAQHLYDQCHTVPDPNQTIFICGQQFVEADPVGNYNVVIRRDSC